MATYEKHLLSPCSLKGSLASWQKAMPLLEISIAQVGPAGISGCATPALGAALQR